MPGIVRFLTFSLALILSLLSTQATLAEEFPPEYYARHNDYRQVKISPDGKHFAATFLREGQSVLATIDRENMKVLVGVKAANDGHIEQFWWANDERLIYTISQPNGAIDYPVATPEIYAVDVDGRKHKNIYGYRASGQKSATRLRQKESSYASFELLSPLPDDKKNILITEYPWHVVGNYWVINPAALPRIYLVNTVTGYKREIERLPITNSSAVTDAEHNVRFAVGPDDNNNVRVRFRNPGDTKWLEFTLNDINKNSLGIMGFGADANVVYLAAARRGENTDTLFRLDLASGESTEVMQHDTVDLDWFLVDVESDEIVGVRLEPGRPQYHYLAGDENQTVAIHKMLSEAFPGQEVSITSATRDGREMVVLVDSDKNPGDYYLFDAQTKQASYLFSRRSWVDPADSQDMTPIVAMARDGTELSGYITLPAGGQRPFPMVVVPHGGPHGVRDRWAYDSDTQFLANRGFAVLRINFRGSNGYGIQFRNAGLGQWGGLMIDDVTDATRWAIGQGYADPDRICIYGASYGGYSALMSAIREPEVYQCAVSYVGVTDLRLIFDEDSVRSSDWATAYFEQALGTDEAALQQASPAQQINKLTIPLLVASGGDDRTVPVEHAEVLKKSLDENGKDYEWLMFDDEGHGYWQVDHRVEFYDRLEAFLDEHIGKQTEVASAQ